ncbi:MAG: hypothetical protein P4L84_11685 [Isosphaeraceae bacterium]|nr:hypothetical protein [Isosphaeraceae bacterium]
MPSLLLRARPTATTWPLAVLWLLASAHVVRGQSSDDLPTYERDIKPLFAQRCTVCHSAKKVDNAEISGGLALDSYDATVGGTKAHKVITPGKADSSELVRRLNDADEDRRMPLQDKPLTEPQRRLVERWVAVGAPRGAAPAVATVATKPDARRVIRSLDVVLPVETKVPAGVAGLKAGGSAQLALKVGPLPSITSLAFRGDGRVLAVGTNGSVVLWDLADGRPALTLNDIPGPVHALAFSRDGKRLAVGAGLPARSGLVRVYSVPDGTLLHDFDGHGDVVFGLAFRPNGAQLASASLDTTVRFWNLAIGRADGVFRGHSDFVYDVAYTPDGQWLLSASKDRTVKRINTTTFKEKQTYSDHDDDVLSVALQPGGVKFVSAGNEPQLRWWPVAAEKPDLRSNAHGGPVHQLVFSANGKRLVSASGDGTVRLWDGVTGTPQRTLAGPSDWQYAVAISDDGKVAAAGGWDGLVRVWDADSGQLRATLIQPPTLDGRGTEWLALAPAGYVTLSDPLAGIARWKVGGVDVAGDALLPVFGRADELGHALRGEAVGAPSFPQPKKL